MENTGLFVFILWIWILKSSCADKRRCEPLFICPTFCVKIQTAHCLCSCCCCADQSRCEPLFMCPTFCMKMKDGCYICNCGMFTDYMKKSADEISRVSHEQSPQTGSQLSTYTSGYDVIQPKQSGTGTGFVDYRTMFRGVFSPDRPANPKPKQLSDLELQRYLFQNGGMLSPDFTDFDQIVGSMPGMGCPLVSKHCPAPCLTTDVYTGCIKCTCDMLQTRPQTSTASPTTPTPTSRAVESSTTKKINQNNNENSPIPFKIPTPAPTHMTQKIPTPMFTTNVLRHGNQLEGQGRNDNNIGHLSSKTEIMVPTLPTEADKQATQSDIFIENFNILDIFHPNKNRSQLEQPHDGVSPLTEINLHREKVFTGQNKENDKNHSSHGIFVQRFPGYASPTPKPKHNNASSIPFQQAHVPEGENDVSFDKHTPKEEAITVKQRTHDDDRESSPMDNETGQDGPGNNRADNDRDIFDYLDEVITDSNTVSTGGYFGNVINKGLSLQEMAEIGTAF